MVKVSMSVRRNLLRRSVTVRSGDTWAFGTIVLVRRTYILVSGNTFVGACYFFDEEGVTWVRGVTSKAANALRAAIALSPRA